MTIALRNRWLVPIGLPVLLVLLAVPAYHLAKSARFDTDAPEGNYPEPVSLAEGRAQDVEHLGLFFELERSWTPASLDEARHNYEALQENATNLSDAEFELAVARIVATADNAHTKVREYSRTPRYSRLPIRGHMFDDGYYLIRAHRDHEHLLGQRLTAIDDKSLSEIRDGLRQYVGGNDATFDKYLPYLMESPELLHAAGLIASRDSVSLILLDDEGQTNNVTLDAPYPSSSEQIGRSYLLLAPQVYSQSQPEWLAVHTPDAKLPLYLQAPFKQFQFVQNEDSDFSYLQFWSNNDVGDRSISAFCKDALEAFRRNPTDILIIDHRFNSGGNYHTTADCMTDFGHSLPPDGHLYVIIGGPTFSAGIISAATAIVAATGRVTVIGAPVGDRLISWGEDNLLKLPNSGIEIKFSTGKHDLVNGCRDWRQCYWGNLFSDLRIASLEPNPQVPLTFADYRDGRDPVMAVILSSE